MKCSLVRLLLVILASLPLFAGAAGEETTSNTAKPFATQMSAEQTVDINSADATTLQQLLTGIGAVKAKAIVDYRQEHGAFASVDELLDVKGIGVAILEQNRSKLRVD